MNYRKIFSILPKLCFFLFLAFLSASCGKKGFKALQSYAFEMEDTVFVASSAESFRYTLPQGITIQLDTAKLDSQLYYYYYSIVNDSSKPLWLNNNSWHMDQSVDTLSLFAFPFWHYYVTSFHRIDPGKIWMNGCPITEHPTKYFNLTLCFIENYQLLLEQTKGDPAEVDVYKNEYGWEVYIPHNNSPDKGIFFLSFDNYVPTDTTEQVIITV